MDIQVSKQHYDFDKYTPISRWQSYYYQILEATNDKDIHSILLIGVGDMIVPNVIKTIWDGKLDTFDFDRKLKPDIVGDVTDITKYVKNQYDCVVCCEVLEHIPFELLDKTLDQISKITKKKMVFSLPYNHKNLLSFNTHIFPKINYRASLDIPRFWKKKWRKDIEGLGEHYYELNTVAVSKKDVVNIINNYFYIKKQYRPYEHRYHQFFILTPKKF